MKRRWLRCAAALALAACVAGPVAAAESIEACLGDARYLQMVEGGADRALCAPIENVIIESACSGE